MSSITFLLTSRSRASVALSSRISLCQFREACLLSLGGSEHRLPWKNPRPYTSSALLLEETAKASRKRANDFAVRRATYKKHVSRLRKEYAAEVAAQRAADEAEREAKQQEQTRLKLERQRLKNMRSARNAIRQLEMQQQREQEFQEELRVAQENRDARKERFRKARQMVVDELEAEAHLWLTTPEEVEKAFTPENEQLLWARPNSVLGAPSPSDDVDFWRYESHTWHMDKTYPTQRELLLEELQENSYFGANIDASFWTEERLGERKELEDKAKLRAMVRDEGRRVLLEKQKELLQDNFSEKMKLDVPKSMPVPNVQVLANTDAMEKEGAEVLLSDPTRFFEFEPSTKMGTAGDQELEGGKERDSSSSYQGPSLGTSVGLKDPIRSIYSQNRPYPIVVGKMPKPDLRTEKQKKREAKEKAMWAAIQGESAADKQQADIEFEAEDSYFDTSEPLDYDALVQQYDSDGEEQAEGIDTEKDPDLAPPEKRHKEDDVEWVIGQLEQKIKNLEEQLRFELETAQQEIRAKHESETGEQQLHVKDRDVVDEGEAIRHEGTDERGQSYVQYELPGRTGNLNLRSIGFDVDEAEHVLSSLSEEQLLGLYSLDGLDTQSMSSDELREALNKVPGLSENQVASIVKLEESLANNDIVKEALGMDADTGDEN